MFLFLGIVSMAFAVLMILMICGSIMVSMSDSDPTAAVFVGIPSFLTFCWLIFLAVYFFVKF